jgi:hypothetical protein
MSLANNGRKTKKVPSSGTFSQISRFELAPLSRRGGGCTLPGTGHWVPGGSGLAQATRLGSSAVSNEKKSDQEKNRAIRIRQRAIGRELRRIYDDVVKEPIPDDFVNLLQKIEDKQTTPETKPEDR